MTVSDESRRLATIAALAADEKLARNIAVFDVSDVMAITDVFVVASADNERQVGAIVEEVEDELTKAGVEPKRREGNRENRWVLLDYVDVVVHVQHSEERTLYSLERLWKDCPRLELGLPDPEPSGDDDEQAAQDAW